MIGEKYAVEILPETHCDVCGDIIHNHFDKCPACGDERAGTDAYLNLVEDRAGDAGEDSISCESCGTVFRKVSRGWYGYPGECILEHVSGGKEKP